MKKLFGRVASILGAKPTTTDTSSPDMSPPSEAAAQQPFSAFEPHNEIERLLMDAAVNADTRPAFEQALLEAELYAATPDTPEVAGQRVVGEGEYLQLLNVESPEGMPVAAVFTAQERIAEAFGPGVGYVGMSGSDLLNMVSNQGAWLNPGFPYGVFWTADDLNAVLGKPSSRTIEKDTQILLGAPAQPPTALIESLQAALGSDPRIAEAWLALAHWPEDSKESWYLDIRTDLDGAALQDMLADTFRHADYAGLPLDMVVNEPGQPEGIGIRIAPLQTS